MVVTHAKKPTQPKRLKYLSLFSGIEAASVAWHDFDWSCVGVSEIDPFACEVLKQRYPNVPNLGDITKITEEQLYELKEKHGRIDIVVGGSPCQSFSTAGKRLGLKDPRGNLMFEYCRVVRTLLPQYFIWENVRGALSSNGGRDFSTLIGEMAKFGYSLCWRCLDAQHFGIPQRRLRVFLVGSLGKNLSAFNILFESASRTRHLISCQKQGESNSSKIEKGIGKYAHETYNITFNDANGLRKDRPNGGCYINQTSISNAITTGGVGDTRIVEESQTEIAAPVSKGNGECWENYNTFTSLSLGGGQMGQGYAAVRIESKVRRLTPLECERLQGFPDGWTKISYKGGKVEDCPSSLRYKAIGNSMAVPVMRFIGLGILEQGE